MLIEESERFRDACRLAAELILKSGGKDVNRVKLKVSKEFKLSKVPSNIEILENAPEELKPRLSRVLVKKPVKTISGVSVITIVTPMRSCPHGGCIYCPGGSNVPKSHSGEEDVIKSAMMLDYDPFLQARRHIDKLEKMGHIVDKVELIFIAGTFNALPWGYQKWFVKRCLDALNGRDSNSIGEALTMAEDNPRYRVSGITVETRPDWVKLSQAQKLLELGVTRVEIGVQAIDDEIYALINRGHTVEDVVEATRTLKDLAFKVGYHLMPNLPGSSLERDLEMYEMIWGDPRFRPDMIKIYPTLVLPGTKLYELWKNGFYEQYSDEELIELLAKWFEATPPYVRIQRVQREIPLRVAVAGNKVANLREVVEEYLRKKGSRCRCIRCREVGHKFLREGVGVDLEKVRLFVRKYEASEGMEYFISYEDPSKDILIGFIRLRSPSKILRKELEGAALVRELHVYGKMIPVGERSSSEIVIQHRSFGSKLLEAAERIAVEELDARKIAVISGVGVKKYYYKRGYEKDGPYVSKRLDR